MSFFKIKLRYFLVVLFLVSLILQTGCAFKDIDKRSFIVGIGIDPSESEEKGYKITLKLALPISSIKQATGPTYAYLTHEGETISESLRNLEAHNDKFLDLGHLKMIVINEDLLTEDISEFMNYFVRKADIQLIAYVAAARPSAEHILKTEPETETPSSIALFNFFDTTGTDSPLVTTAFLFKTRRDFYGKGIDVVLPLIESNEDQSELIIDKSLVVKDKHEPTEMTPTQTAFYNVLANNMNGFHYKVKKDDDLTYFIMFNRHRVNYKIKTEKGHPPKAEIKISMSGRIEESSKTLSLKDLKEYEKTASKEIEKGFRELLTILQEKKVDPFGFGLRYRATRLNDKNTFTQWERMYPDLEFDISIKVSLKNTEETE